MTHGFQEPDYREFELGYAHAILSYEGLNPDGFEWVGVGPDDFTELSVGHLRRDCLAFICRVLEVTGLDAAGLATEHEFYDLGWAFFCTRMGCDEHGEFDDTDIGTVLRDIAENGFGELYIERDAEGRIHYPSTKWPVPVDGAISASVTQMVAEAFPSARVAEERDYRRGTQRAFWTRYG